MRKSILLLTSAAVSLMLAFSACSGDDKETPPDRPILSSEAGIANIAISHGELTPAFRDDVRNYGASFHTEVSAFSVIVRLKDEKARLTINGNSAGSGQTFPVALSEGRNVINIAVIAEDGKNSNVASVTASVMKLNTKVYVLDGIGGAPVEGAMITLKDASNRLLASNIPLPANKQGTALLGLDPNQKYHIYAKGSNSSEACFAYFDPSKETTAALYCLPGWSAPYVREAPVIERISFADNGGTAATWKDMPSGENQITASHLEIPFVRITAISRNPIIYESGVGTAGPQVFPIQVAMDGKAWAETPFIAWGIVEAASPVMIGASRYYRTTYVLPMPYCYISDDGAITYAPMITPDHWLDIVVYDQANNRTEQRLYLTLTDAGPSSASDTDISAMTPRIQRVQGHTYGISQNLPGANPIEIPGVSPVEGHGVTCFNWVEFYLTDAWADNLAATNNFPAIRGFEVYRSADGVNFNKIDAIHYVTPNRGVLADYTPDWQIGYRQLFTYRDISSHELAENVTYYYKIRAFNYNPANGGYSPMSITLSNKLLPAFVTQLTEPHHNSVTNKLWPTFKFRVTNPALPKADMSDNFYFGLCLKNVYDAYVIFMLPFMADFTRLDEAGNPWIGCFNFWDWDYMEAVYYDQTGNPVPFVHIADDGTITIEGDNEAFQNAVYINSITNGWEYELLPSQTYEWNIFGEDPLLPGVYTGLIPTNSAFFYKSWPAPEGAATNAFSFGSTIEHKLGSPNGFFILTIDPAAQ